MTGKGITITLTSAEARAVIAALASWTNDLESGDLDGIHPRQRIAANLASGHRAWEKLSKAGARP